MGQGESLPRGRLVVLEQTPYGTVVEEGNQQHFVKEFSYTEQQAYQQAFIEYSKRLSQKHEHILSVMRTNTKVQNTFCSTFYKMTVVYEYISRSLHDEIQQRASENKTFDEKEVWSVLCSCALAMSEVVSLRGKAHSALHPRDIRLSSDGGVKLLHWQMTGDEEGTPQMLAHTVMQCLAEEYEGSLQHLNCSGEMKSILQLMLKEKTTFGEIQEHLFKLVQEESQSLTSYSNTSVLKGREEHKKVQVEKYKKQTYTLESMECEHKLLVKAPLRDSIQAREVRVADTLVREAEDMLQMAVEEMKSVQAQTPDQSGDQSEEQEQSSNRRENTYNASSQFMRSREFQFIKNKELGNTNTCLEFIREIQSKEAPYQKNLFTDPQLMHLIKNDLQQLKKKKNNQCVFSAIDTFKEDSSRISLKNNYATAQFASSSCNSMKEEEHMHPQLRNSNLMKRSNVSVKKAEKEDQLQPIFKRKTDNVKDKQTHIQIKDCDNIMMNEEMGFRKTKQSSISSSNFCSVASSVRQTQRFKEQQSNNQEQLTIERQSNRTNQRNTLKQRNVSFVPNDNVKQMQALKAMKQISFAKQVFKTQNNSNNSLRSSILQSSKVSLDQQSFMKHKQMKVLPMKQKISLNPSSESRQNIKQSVVRQKQTVLLKQNAVVKSRQNQKSIPHETSNDNNELQYVNETYLRGRYEGTKWRAMRHGKGVFYYNEGGKYIGGWVENKMHGRGVLYYPNNHIAYEGEWVDDQLHGEGTLYNEEVSILPTPFDYRDWTHVEEYWIKYEGRFANDNKQGKGKLYLSNGEIFQGLFHNDMVSGEGILFRKDGSRVKGVWNQNTLLRLL